MENKKSILCVEDDRTGGNLQQSLKEIYHVTSSASFNDAVEHLENKVFDIVITDVEIGTGENGYELVKWIRKNISTSMSVIVCSASSFKRDKSEAYAAGADYFLVKPIQKYELLEVIDVVIKGKSI